MYAPFHNSRWTVRFIAIVIGTWEIEAGVEWRTHHGDGSADYAFILMQIQAAIASEVS